MLTWKPARERESNTVNPIPVVAVILNWKRPADTLACLRALGDRLPVVVVDNGSGDDSLELIRSAKPDVPLLVLGENRGYTGGNNAGIQWALAQNCEWILLLNDDVILARGALEAMLAAGRGNPRAGFVGPLVLHAHPADLIQSAGGWLDKRWRSGHRGANQPDQGQYQQAESLPWLSGCALLVRSQMVREIGLLDERFFLYEEELEWCLRARQAGWEALFVPQAKAWHAGVTPDYEPGSYITYYMTRNHLLLLSKLRAGWLPRLDAAVQAVRTLLSWTFKPRWRGKRAHRDALWRGLMDYLGRRWGPMSPQNG